MEIKIVNYIDLEKQAQQKKAVENANLEEFKTMLQDALEEEKASTNAPIPGVSSSNMVTRGTIDSSAYQTSNSATATGVSTASTSSASSDAASQALGCPSDLDAYFEEAANTYQVDVNLLKAIAKQESAYQSDAVSSSGAVGIMQLMPSTASSLGVSDSYNAYENIMGGAKYISSLLERYNGDTSLALAAYNAGPGNVDKYNGIPPFEETQNYVEKVTNYYNTAKAAESAASTEGDTTTDASDESHSSETKAKLYASIEQVLDLIQDKIEEKTH